MPTLTKAAIQHFKRVAGRGGTKPKLIVARGKKVVAFEFMLLNVNDMGQAKRLEVQTNLSPFQHLATQIIDLVPQLRKNDLVC